MAGWLDDTTVARTFGASRTVNDSAGTRNPYLTALTGSLVGRTYQLGPGRLIVGRAQDSDIALDDEGVSRRHALLICTVDGRVTVEDLGSTNGSLVDGELVEVHELQGGERLQFGSKTVFKFEFRDSIEERFVSYLYESATRDHLTKAFNKRFLSEQLHVEYAWHRRHEQPLTLILIDVDHFKRINDEFGHLVGDTVLRELTERCQTACRTEDILARYGGEEFACLLRQTEGQRGVMIAERMRHAVEETPFVYKGPGRAVSVSVTASLGVVALTRDMEQPEALVEKADRLLYEAKLGGRNQVASEV